MVTCDPNVIVSIELLPLNALLVISVAPESVTVLRLEHPANVKADTVVKAGRDMFLREVQLLKAY